MLLWGWKVEVGWCCRRAGGWWKREKGKGNGHGNDEVRWGWGGGVGRDVAEVVVAEFDGNMLRIGKWWMMCCMESRNRRGISMLGEWFCLK